MSKLKFVFAISLLFIVSTTVIQAKEPPNLGLLKIQLVKYHDDGSYEKEINKVIKKAKYYLTCRIKENKDNKKKLAIVLDIDDTSISTYDQMLKLRFGGRNKDLDDMLEKHINPAIPATLKLYNFAKTNNVSMFFITGRPEKMRLTTKNNLKQVGYKTWKNLYLRPDDYNANHKSIVPFKSMKRKQIEEQGYDIILSIGDQKSDLTGGYADMTYKVPNPYYYIP